MVINELEKVNRNVLLRPVLYSFVSGCRNTQPTVFEHSVFVLFTLLSPVS